MKLTKQINLVNRGVLKSLILKNGPGWQTTESKGYLLIESGPDRVLENKVVTIINAAQEMICLQSFLIQDSDIINALVTAVEQRKVRVFVLSASNVRLKDNMEEEPDFKRADYVQMLEKKFRYNFVHRSSENFHAKFIVADAQTKPLGLICTNNFTTMGFAKNVEAGVLLSPEQCLELYKVFVYNFWECAQHEFLEKNFEPVNPLKKYTLPESEHILLTSPLQSDITLKPALERSIAGAKKSIQFSTFGIDIQQSTVQAIAAAAKKGIDVTLFSRDSEKLARESLQTLMANGVKIYLQPFLHAKVLITDEAEGFLFTANFQKHGLDEGCEVGLRLSVTQLEHMLVILQQWKQTFAYHMVPEIKIAELNTYYTFNENGRLIEKSITADEKNEVKNIQKVADLRYFFNGPRELIASDIRFRKLTLAAEVPGLKEAFRKLCTNTGPFEILQTGKDKQICVLHQTFLAEMITDLPTGDMNIYAS